MKKYLFLFLLSFQSWATCYKTFYDKNKIYWTYNKTFDEYILKSYTLEKDILLYEEMIIVNEIDLLKNYYVVECPIVDL